MAAEPSVTRLAAITLTTDFGSADGYVGEVKGVLATRAPGAALIDVAHEVAPGDVRGAAWNLRRIWTRFPAGTIHLAIVDPGVGGERLPIVARSADRWFVGPDNGLITLVDRAHSVGEARRIRPESGERPLSDTFHGRDVFAPAAAHLAAGRSAEEIGPPVEPSRLARLDTPEPERDGPLVRGHVLHVDRFGNLITTVPNDWLPEAAEAEIAGVRIPAVSASYDAVERGHLLLTRGSGGTLEISVRDGSAAERLGVQRDAEIVVRPAGPES